MKTLLSLLLTANLAFGVTLGWDASPDTDVVSYNIYYGTNSGNYNTSTNVGDVLEVNIPNLEVGITYYFIATAESFNGLESLPTSEVAYTVPLVILPFLTIAPEINIVSSNVVNEVWTNAQGQVFNTWTNIVFGPVERIVVSWPPEYTHVLQYSTTLINPNWIDSPTGTNNPAYFEIDGIPTAYFRVSDYTPPTPTNYLTIQDINAIDSNNNICNLNVDVVNDSLIVVSISSETSGQLGSVNSSPSLNWIRVGESGGGEGGTSDGDSEIWYAEATAGNYDINTFLGFSFTSSSAAAYVIEGYVNPTSSVSQVDSGGMPDINISTSGNNSLVIAVNSDWDAILGPVSYFGNATEVLLVSKSGAYQSAHWWVDTTTQGSYRVGQSAPVGQNSGMVVFEVRAE